MVSILPSYWNSLAKFASESDAIKLSPHAESRHDSLWIGRHPDKVSTKESYWMFVDLNEQEVIGKKFMIFSRIDQKQFEKIVPSKTYCLLPVIESYFSIPTKGSAAYDQQEQFRFSPDAKQYSFLLVVLLDPSLDPENLTLREVSLVAKKSPEKITVYHKVVEVVDSDLPLTDEQIKLINSMN
jgi:hypothetical protein